MMFSLLSSKMDSPEVATPDTEELPEWSQALFEVSSPFCYYVLQGASLRSIRSLINPEQASFFESNIKIDKQRAMDICR